MLIVDLTVNPAREQEWNRWYETTYRRGIEAASLATARRYLGSTAGSHRYKTLYIAELPPNPLNWERFVGDVEATARVFSPLDTVIAGDPGLSSHLLIVDATIEATSEEDWNTWYNEVHLPEILDCPGFVCARRFLSDAGGGRRYVAVYEIESPAALQSEEFLARRGWGPFLGRVQPTARLYSAMDHNTGGPPPPITSPRKR